MKNTGIVSKGKPARVAASLKPHLTSGHATITKLQNTVGLIWALAQEIRMPREKYEALVKGKNLAQMEESLRAFRDKLMAENEKMIAALSPRGDVLTESDTRMLVRLLKFCNAPVCNARHQGLFAFNQALKDFHRNWETL